MLNTMFPTDLHLLCLINIINTTPKKINSGAYSETLNVRICTVKVVPIAEPSTIPKACDSVITDPPTSPTTRMFVTVLLCKKKVTTTPLIVPFILVSVIVARYCLILDAPSFCKPLLSTWVPYRKIPSPPIKPSILAIIIIPSSINYFLLFQYKFKRHLQCDHQFVQGTG